MGVGLRSIAPIAAHGAVAAAVERAVDASPLASKVSVVVRDVDTGGVLAAIDPERLVAPASNMKLLTAIASLRELGPSARFNTTVATDATSLGPQLDGSIYLVGGGDPALRAQDIADLADDLAARGVRHVTGDVLVDVDALDHTPWVSTQPERYRLKEINPVGALPRMAFDPAASDAGLGAGMLLRQDLERSGVRVDGGVAYGDAPATAALLAGDTSPELRDILKYMLKHSNATTAEVLGRQLGALDGGPGTTEAGVAVIRRSLDGLGVDVDHPGVALVDASGLTPSTRITTDLLADAAMRGLTSEGTGDDLWRAMSIAGTDGTLRSRLDWPDVAGRIRAKTGTHDTSILLTGATDPETTRQAAFSIVVHDDAGVPRQQSRNTVDSVATAILRAVSPAE